MIGDDVGFGRSVDAVAHVIQVALTPVFLLSGIASLLGVFVTRLARVADRIDLLVDKLRDASPDERAVTTGRLRYLRRRSHLLDGAVIIGTVAGASTCLAALLLFVGTLRDQAVVTLLFACFGVALLSTGCALALFLGEILLASRGMRDKAIMASEFTEGGEGADLPEPGDPSDGSALNAAS